MWFCCKHMGKELDKIRKQRFLPYTYSYPHSIKHFVIFQDMLLFGLTLMYSLGQYPLYGLENPDLAFSRFSSSWFERFRVFEVFKEGVLFKDDNVFISVYNHVDSNLLPLTNPLRCYLGWFVTFRYIILTASSLLISHFHVRKSHYQHLRKKF